VGLLSHSRCRFEFFVEGTLLLLWVVHAEHTLGIALLNKISKSKLPIILVGLEIWVHLQEGQRIGLAELDLLRDVLILAIVDGLPFLALVQTLSYLLDAARQYCAPAH